MRLSTKVSALAMALVAAAPVHAGLVSARVEVTTIQNAGFSAPIFTFRNQSDHAAQITGVTVGGAIPWDWVNSATIQNPGGGSRTLLVGEETNNFNSNNGCTSSIQYGLTGFDTGEFFSFDSDPESPGCGNAVVDIQPFLTPLLQASDVNITVVFDGAVSLSGSAWDSELINQAGSTTDPNNLRYFMTLSQDTNGGSVPEPGSLALVGLGLAGALVRRRAPAIQGRLQD